MNHILKKKLYSYNGPLYLPNLLYYELKVLDSKIKWNIIIINMSNKKLNNCVISINWMLNLKKKKWMTWVLNTWYLFNILIKIITIVFIFIYNKFIILIL